MFVKKVDMLEVRSHKTLEFWVPDNDVDKTITVKCLSDTEKQVLENHLKLLYELEKY